MGTAAGLAPFLLHIVRSPKSNGKGACILRHGVLFCGNAEADALMGEVVHHETQPAVAGRAWFHAALWPGAAP
ncbi:MAG: N-6 DNA methylase [Bryobacteraceae bacterium]